MKRVSGILLLAGISLGTLLFLRAPGSTPSPMLQGRPASAWASEIASRDYLVRMRAADVLGAGGTNSVRALARMLHKSDPPLKAAAILVISHWPQTRWDPQEPGRCRETAAVLLGRLGVAAEAAVPDLIEAISDSNSDVSCEAERALRKIGTPALPALEFLLTHGNSLNRARAAEALGEFGPDAARSLPLLIAAMNSPEREVRANSVTAIAALGRRSLEAKTALLSATTDSSAQIRASAAEGLARLEIKHADVANRLLQLIHDDDPLVRVHAAKSLWEVAATPSPSLGVLVNALSDPVVGWRASLALGEIGSAAEPAVPALMRWLKREKVHRPLRTPPSSALALSRIGGPAVDPLIEALNDNRIWVKTSAAVTLGFIGKAAAKAAPAMSALINHKDTDLRQAAALGLAAIAPERRELVPVLIELVKEDDISISTTALTLLQQIDPKAADEVGPK